MKWCNSTWTHSVRELEVILQLKTAELHLLEMQVLEGEMCFHDACGLNSGPQHILLRGDVIRLGYPLQVI